MRETTATVNGVDCLGAADIVAITAAGELSMIGSFRNKALRDLFMRGKAAKISPDLRQRCLNRLDSLDAAKSLKSLDLPGFRLHGLQGKPKRYSLWVNGPWRITFEWVDGKAERVDLEQYH